LFGIALEAKAWSAERDQAHRAWLAWHTAALSRCEPKKFPTLESLSGQSRKVVAQTPEQMKSVFAAMRVKQAGVRTIEKVT
jgi:hypothetical protein